MLNISTIILTYNEEIHIERCIRNAQQFSSKVFVVDSYSTDNTVAIAESLGAIVYQNKWENNHAKQFNWGLDTLPIATEWVFRLDADEYLTDELIAELHQYVPALTDDIAGVIMERKMVFLGRQINRGNVQWNMLRLFRYGLGKCEDRWMDEHIVLHEGRPIQLKNCFVDDNRNPLGWWIQKHNGYAIREAIDLLDIEYGLIHKSSSENTHLSADAATKRQKKLKYARMPLFWRSTMYFIYRYFFKLGFLEGKEGFLWHFLQGWWYRTLVDAKIYEIRKDCGQDPEKIKAYIKANYQIELE